MKVMELTFDYFFITYLNFKRIFSSVNNFLMFEPGSVNGRREALQTQTREPIKSIRITPTRGILFNIQPQLFTENIQI